MNRITSEVMSSSSYANAVGTRNSRPAGQAGRLQDRTVVPGNPGALPVFPPQPPMEVRTDHQIVEGRTEQRVRADALPVSLPPTDILRRAAALGILKEVQDAAAALISERRGGTPADEHKPGLPRSARRYLSVLLAESCLDHGGDDAAICSWLDIDLTPIDRRRLPFIRDERRELETSSDRTEALGPFHAALAAESTPDAPGFVASYLQQIQEIRSFGGRLMLLLRKHHFRDLMRIVRQMLVALRTDLEAATPSREPRWLASVLQDMGHMHLTNTLVDQLQELQTFMEGLQNPERRHAMDTHALMGELVGLIEQGTAVPSQVERLVDAAGFHEPQDRIPLLVRLSSLLMSLPARLFHDAAHQTLLVGCVRHCLDQAIEAEEYAADDPAGASAP